MRNIVWRAQKIIDHKAEIPRLNNFADRLDAIAGGASKTVDHPRIVRAAELLHSTVGTTLGRFVSLGLRNRSKNIVALSSEFLNYDSSILDLGCGDGEVGRLLSLQGHAVTLCDVLDYRKSEVLPFQLYDGKSLPFENDSFDYVLLLTVLHHSDDPRLVMREALRVARESVIIIESVYFNETHRKINSFFDWFYNRVLNDPNINVPLNFLTPNAWLKFFEYSGGKAVHMEHLGINEPLVPEWHTLYVVKPTLDNHQANARSFR